jgi:hypothetical protein
LLGRGWQVVEADTFALGAVQCGGFDKVEEAIAGIKHALSRDPHGFHQSRSRPDIWIARTKIVITGPDVVLSHRVLYKIDAPQRTVLLLWVEFTDPEIEDDWDDEPF